jgi:hypothetical protein
LEALARGTHFTFTINGQVVSEVDDDHFCQGLVGLAIEGYTLGEKSYSILSTLPYVSRVGMFRTIRPLEQTAEAHRYVDQGSRKGNVMITLEHNK